MLPTLSLHHSLLSFLSSATGHDYVTAFVTAVVIDQSNVTHAPRSDISPRARSPLQQPIPESRPERPAGNHVHTCQFEPGLGDGVLLEKSCFGETVGFSRSLSVLTFPKLLLLPGAFFSSQYFP